MPAGDLQNIKGYLVVSETIGSAGQPTAEQFAAIREAGYEVVINLATSNSSDALPHEREIVTGLGMSYVHIPVVWEAPTARDLDEFLGAMDRYCERPVFVHCAANMRVSAFLFLYRVLRLGVAVEEAKAMMGRIWEPNPIWQRFIDESLARWQG